MEHFLLKIKIAVLTATKETIVQMDSTALQDDNEHTQQINALLESKT